MESHPGISSILQLTKYVCECQGLTVISIVLIASLLIYAKDVQHFMWLVFKTGPRDLISLVRLLRTKWFLKKLKWSDGSVVTVFRDNCKKFPNRPLFYHENTVWTFSDLDKYSNAIANIFISRGFLPGDEVALILHSKPEYVGIWLGLAKAGIITALVNTNLKDQSLAHSISSMKCKAIIFGIELKDTLVETIPLLEEASIQYYCIDTSYNSSKFSCPFNKSTGEIEYRQHLSTSTSKPFLRSPIVAPKSFFPVECLFLHSLIDKCTYDSPVTHKAKLTDRLFYIFTSGTTGLPKAAIIKHSRYIWIGSALRNLSGISGHNTIYNCLPLYHLSGGVLGTNQALIWGDTMVIRHKFSASAFWSDCITYNCNIAQYIGEICRYLLAQPKSLKDKCHNVETIFGNGLRPQLWGEFVERFNIKNVIEFYGSTEGNANIINNTNQPGACGFISQLLPRVYPVSLIKVHEDTYEAIRDEKTGLCLRAGPGESGEFIGKIIQNDDTRAFDGYVDKKATETKIIHNVFRKGDIAFSSGDILYCDQLGYLYFSDRRGDTFRWKGENVSTTEIECIISSLLKLRDCIVYGVEVPGCEGKAGMVAIRNPEKNISLDKLLYNLHKRLPLYCIPVFVRLVDQVEATSTFKLPKNKLQEEAYSLAIIEKDPVFYLDCKANVYRRMDGKVFHSITTGKIRL